jgi:hypothetical protein
MKILIKIIQIHAAYRAKIAHPTLTINPAAASYVPYSTA